ncbi:MAG: sortase B protein-sorting domain-containing protein [Marinilabiliaceae bacterium]|nr:sortase B protein-sorting domain-containing protein [Marinilabiliaceae bacterium]
MDELPKTSDSSIVFLHIILIVHFLLSKIVLTI